MSQSSIWKWIIAIVVIILVIWGLTSLGTDNPADAALNLDETTEISVDQPLADDVVSSPLAVSGEALGNWYFEAVFPVRLVADDGEVLAETFATAKGDWMTEAMVPFTATVEFTAPEAETGWLLLGKDNASGLPENELWVKVPVRFAVAEEESTAGANDDTGSATSSPTTPTAGIPSTSAPVPATASLIPLKIYLARGADMSANCSQVMGVWRQVPRTMAVARAALNQLLVGPNPAEIAQGLGTSLPVGVKLQSLTINGGVARADFSAELNTGGSCRVTNIRAQISETLKQFPSVSSVIISVNGNAATALQP